jgi:hypothetical protein
MRKKYRCRQLQTQMRFQWSRVWPAGSVTFKAHNVAKKGELVQKLTAELGESRCYAEMGDLIRHDLKDYASELISERWDWSSWIDSWTPHKPYENHETNPAKHLLVAIDRVKAHEKAWAWGSQYHNRLHDQNGGCLLFWSEWCKRYHLRLNAAPHASSKEVRIFKTVHKELGLGGVSDFG